MTNKTLKSILIQILELMGFGNLRLKGFYFYPNSVYSFSFLCAGSHCAGLREDALQGWELDFCTWKYFVIINVEYFPPSSGKNNEIFHIIPVSSNYFSGVGMNRKAVAFSVLLI